MERESFENDEIAALMNEHFVNIKVDREERPDLDQIYMAAVQAMTGHGGWPMSVFLTPGLEPFFGGTYFPPADSRGMAGFPRVLQSVHRAWEERRDEITTGPPDDRTAPGDGGIGKGGDGPLRCDCSTRRPASSSATSIPRKAGSASPQISSSHGLEGLAPAPCPDRRRPGAARGHLHARPDGRGGESTTIWAAALHATPPTSAGWFPTSRRCSTTMPCWPRLYLEAFQATGDADLARVARETLDYIAAPDDRTGGRLLLDRRRRQRGRRRQVLRLVAAPRSSACWAIAARHSALCTMSRKQATGKARNILNLPRPIEHAARLLRRDEAEVKTKLAQAAPGCWPSVTPACRRPRIRRFSSPGTA